MEAPDPWPRPQKNNRLVVSVDLTDLEDIYSELERVSRTEERTVEAQIRYWLKLWLNVEQGA